MTTLIRNVNQAAADKLRVWLNEARSGSCILSPEVTIEAVEGGGLMIRVKQYQDYTVLERRIKTLESDLHRRRYLP